MNAQFKHPITQAAQAEWPAVFALIFIDTLSGGAINHKTIRNKRSLSLIPSNCFAKSGRKVLVHRDTFLAWWETQLESA
jgi:hypothetical protein